MVPAHSALKTDYKISLSGNGKHIRVDVYRPMTNVLGRHCGSDAAELGSRKGLNLYLFDLRQSPNIESILNKYHFAYREMEAFGFPRMARSALLIDPEDRSHDFMETVFLNAGYTVKLFCDESSALNWLED